MTREIRPKRKIIHIIDSLSTGGAEELLIGVVVSLKTYDHIIVTLWNDNDYREITNQHLYYCLNYKGKLGTLKAVRKLKQLIIKYNTKIVHSHLLVATSIARLAVNNPCKLIFSVHGELSKGAFKISKLSKLIEKLTYSKKDTALFVSNTVKNDYANSIGLKGNYHILYNYIADKYFKNKGVSKVDDKGPLKFVSIGKFKIQKNQSLLINAFAQLDPEKYTLDIFGDGPLEEMLNNEIKNSKAQNINLRAKTKDVDVLLKKYQYFIISSTTEGFGIAPLEAMASNLPCLLPNIPIFQELTPKCAIYFDPYSIEGLVECIRNLDLRSLETKEMIERATLRVSEIASKEKYIHKLGSIYNSL